MPSTRHCWPLTIKVYRYFYHPPAHLFMQYIMCSFCVSLTLQDTEDSKKSNIENLPWRPFDSPCWVVKNVVTMGLCCPSITVGSKNEIMLGPLNIDYLEVG